MHLLRVAPKVAMDQLRELDELLEDELIEKERSARGPLFGRRGWVGGLGFVRVRGGGGGCV